MKQQTLEESAVDYISEKSERAREYGLVFDAIKFGVKWQQERMYSEEDMKACWTACLDFNKPAGFDNGVNFDDFIKQFKNK